MSTTHPRRLLVEGQGDLRIIAELVEKNGIAWGSKNDPVVEIKQYDGIEALLAPRVLTTEIKASGLEVIGIVVDADLDCVARWQQLKSRCEQAIPSLPETIPIGGLVMSNDNGPRFGVWIMPDNQSSGMIETFLTRLIPSQSQALRDYAAKCLEDSRQHDAPWIDAHHDKALVHTWLAWQNPPGHQLHTAIVANQLKPNTESSTAFIRWFCELYQLENE